MVRITWTKSGTIGRRTFTLKKLFLSVTLILVSGVAQAKLVVNPITGRLDVTGASSSGSVSISTLTAGATNFIFNQNKLQSGATFYVSSASVSGQFSVGSIKFPDGTVQVTSPTAGGGGSTSPGGAPSNVQINNSGSFYGDSGFQYDSSVSSVTIRGSLGTYGLATLTDGSSGSTVPLEVLSHTSSFGSGSNIDFYTDDGFVRRFGYDSTNSFFGAKDASGNKQWSISQGFFPSRVSMRIYNASGSNYISFRSSDATDTADYVLPKSTGTVGQFLGINSIQPASGGNEGLTTLSWQTASGATNSSGGNGSIQIASNTVFGSDITLQFSTTTKVLSASTMTASQINVGTVTASGELVVNTSGFNGALFNRIGSGGIGFSVQNGNGVILNMGEGTGATENFFTGLSGGSDNFFASQGGTGGYIAGKSDAQIGWTNSASTAGQAPDTYWTRNAANKIETPGTLIIDQGINTATITVTSLGTSSSVCTDANKNLTTTGCSSSGGGGSTAVLGSSSTVLTTAQSLGTGFTTLTGSTLTFVVGTANNRAQICFSMNVIDSFAGGWGDFTIILDGVNKGSGSKNGVVEYGPGLGTASGGSASTCFLTAPLSAGSHTFYLQGQEAATNNANMVCNTDGCPESVLEISSTTGSSGGSGGSGYSLEPATVTIQAATITAPSGIAQFLISTNTEISGSLTVQSTTTSNSQIGSGLIIYTSTTNPNTLAVSSSSAGSSYAFYISTSGAIVHTDVGTPSSPIEGQVWNDSTNNVPTAYIGGLAQRMDGTIYTATSSFVYANSVAITTISAVNNGGLGTITLPANFLTPGKMIHVMASGYYSTTSAPTMQIVLKIGGTTIVDSTARTMGSGVSNLPLHTEFWATCQTTGTNGTVWGNGRWLLALGGLPTAPNEEMPAKTSASTVNTTIANDVQLTFTWGTPSASNTMTISNFIIQVW